MATSETVKNTSSQDEGSKNGHLSKATVAPSLPQVDGGWAWVVLVAILLTKVVQGGLIWSMNFFFVIFHEAFGESRTFTSMIGALAFATYHSASPIASLSIQKLGVRTTFILGSLLVTANYLVNIHANSVTYLIITHAAFFGFGLCLIANAALVALSQYFKHYMYLATGVCLAGAGVGMFLFALLVPLFLENYGWRGSMFLLAGIGLQFSIAGALLFPVKSSENSNQSKGISGRQKRFWSESLPLLTSELFWLLSFSHFFFCVSHFSIIVLFKDYAVVRGLKDIFPWAQAALGIGDIIGRVFSSYLANCTSVNTVILYIAVDFYCATIVLSLIFVQTSVSLVICSWLLGFGLGCYVSLLCIAPAAIFGREQFVLALGYTQMMAGVGALVGPPISSYVTDLTGSYTWTLILVASSITIAAGLLLGIHFVQRRIKRQRISPEIREVLP